MKKKIFFSLSIFLSLVTLIKAQTLTLSAPSSVNSGNDIIFTVNGETSTYYVTGATLNIGNSTIPAQIAPNPVTFSVTGGGQTPTTFKDQAFFLYTAPQCVVTFSFDLQVYSQAIGDFVYVSLTKSVTIVPPTVVTQPPGSTTGGTLTNPIYRLYDYTGRRHFYTTNVSERNEILANSGTGLVNFWGQRAPNDWVAEGNMGFAYISQSSGSGSVPFQRFFNHSSYDHFYIANPSSADISNLTSMGYKSEGIIGYIYTTQVAGTIPLYRYFCTSIGHFYTTNFSELGNGNSTWTYEGVSCYVLSAAH